MENKIKCLYCGSAATDETNRSKDEYARLVNCPVCGRYKYNTFVQNTNDYFGYTERDKVAAYLFYNGVHKTHEELLLGNGKREYLWLDSEPHKTEEKNWFEDITIEQVRAFNKLTFSEKISQILRNIEKKSRFYDDWVTYKPNQIISLTFTKRWKDHQNQYDESSLINQIFYILNYMKNNKLIDYGFHNLSSPCTLKLLPDGWARIEKDEQDESNSKNAFIAMSFDKSMDEVQATLKSVIFDNGYDPRIMSEIEHNHQIVPEMLYEIRQAKFLVAELTNHNNGAYFEAGYALGLGKDIIQVCRKDTFDEDGHFDVKQVNTILWEDTDDLYKKLDARIKATIS